MDLSVCPLSFCLCLNMFIKVVLNSSLMNLTAGLSGSVSVLSRSVRFLLSLFLVFSCFFLFAFYRPCVIAEINEFFCINCDIVNTLAFVSILSYLSFSTAL